VKIVCDEIANGNVRILVVLIYSRRRPFCKTKCVTGKAIEELRNEAMLAGLVHREESQELSTLSKPAAGQ
jgi:hypothetical protein